MKKMYKRLAALMLTALLAIGMLPTGAFAAAEQTGSSGISSDAARAERQTEETISVDQAEPEIRTQDTETVGLSLDGVELYSEAYDVLALVNAQRKKAGLSALTMDLRLMSAAMERAAECMVCFDHVRPNGNSFATMLDAYEISWNTAAENIAFGYTSADAVMDAWMNSQGHRENILNADSKAIGIGCFYQEDGSITWVQLFTDHLDRSAVQEEESANVNYMISALPSQLGELRLLLSKDTLAFGNSCKTLTYLMPEYGPPAILETSCLRYSSSKTSVATVDLDGKVTAKSKEGTAVISAFLRDNTEIIASATVTVQNQFENQKPGGVTVSNLSSGIKVKWNSMSGASRYEVYRSVGSGSYKKVATTTKTSWTDTKTSNGTKYRYKVYATQGSMRSKASSSKTMYRLTAVKITSISSPSKGRIDLKWTKNSKATGYRFEVTDNKTGSVDIYYLALQTTSAYIPELRSKRSYTVRIYPYKSTSSASYDGVKSSSKTIKVK